MSILEIRKKYRILYRFLFVLVLIFIVSNILSYVFSSFIFPKLVKNIRVLDNLDVRVKRCNFSFNEGIILKRFSLKGETSEIKAREITFKKQAKVINVSFYSATMDISLLGFLLSNFGGGSETGELTAKCYLKDVKLKINEKSFIDVEEGYLLFEKGNISWNLHLSRELLPLTFQGFASAALKSAFFLTSVEFLNFSIAGAYNWEEDKLDSKIFTKDKIYNFISIVKLTDSDIYVSDIVLGNFKIEGPLTFNLSDKISSPWSFKSNDSKAEGVFYIQADEENIGIDFKVLKAHLKDFELVTNFYIAFAKEEKMLKLHTLGSVVNNKPFPELDVSIKFLKEGVLIEDFNYQGGVRFSANIDKNLNLNLKGEFSDFNVQEIIDLITPIYSRNFYINRINGNISLFFNNGIKIYDISLLLPEGRIWNFSFQKGKLHLIGTSKILEFVNSELVINNAHMAIEGKVNISSFPNRQMFEEIYLVPVSSKLAWGDTSFEERFGERKYSLGTKLNDNVRLDYNVNFTEGDNYNNNEFSLEIEGKQNLKLRMREDEEIMGVEKKIEF